MGEYVSSINNKYLVVASIVAMALVVPQLLSMERRDGIRQQNQIFASSIAGLEKTISDRSVVVRKLEPAYKTWDWVTSLAESFPAVNLVSIPAPDKAARVTHAWWGKLQGSSSDVLLLLHRMDQRESIQLYGFSQNRDKAQAMFYIVNPEKT